jgi:hypothetical protein
LPSHSSLTDHAKELVQLCLVPDTLSDLGIKSFVLLTKTSVFISSVLAANNLLFTEMAAVFALNAVSMPLRSRMAALMQSALTAPECSFDLALGYLVYLLPFSDEPGVSALFRALCQDSAYAELHRPLVDFGFVAIVVRDVRVAAGEGGGRLAGLLHVCASVAQNAVFRGAFAESQFLSALAEIGDGISAGIERNEYWGAVFAACGAETTGAMADFIEPAIAILSEPYDFVTADRIFAVDFIGKMVELRAPGLAAHLTQTFTEVLLRLIAQFPHSSNLQGAIFRLIKCGIEMEELSGLFVRQFIPYALMEGSSPVRSAAAAQSLRLLAKFDADVKAGRVNGSAIRPSMLGRFRDRFLAAYETIRRSEYGGSTTVMEWAAVTPRGRNFR